MGASGSVSSSSSSTEAITELSFFLSTCHACSTWFAAPCRAFFAGGSGTEAVAAAVAVSAAAATAAAAAAAAATVVAASTAALPAAAAALDEPAFACSTSGSSHTCVSTRRRYGKQGGSHLGQLPLSGGLFECQIVLRCSRLPQAWASLGQSASWAVFNLVPHVSVVVVLCCCCCCCGERAIGGRREGRRWTR